jgi:hypothetical protein
MKYFKMLKKLFNSIFFFEKKNKKQRFVNSQKKSTKHISSFTTDLEHRQSLNTLIDHKLVSNGTEDRTIITNSMLKEYWVIIDHNRTIPKDNKIVVSDKILENDDEITILDPLEINKINNRISYNDQVSDDDKTRLYKPKIKDQDDDMTIISSDQFSNNFSKRPRS